MPTPVAHGLAGLTVHLLAARDLDEAWDPRRAGARGGAALAPDLDRFLHFAGVRNRHSAGTHGIGFALLAAVATSLGARLLAARRPLVLGATAGLGWGSHILLDYLNRDTNPPIGIMAFWPFSREYYKFPWPVF